MKKVTSKTPARISLASGGNDMVDYWSKGVPGFTVSLTINKYVYAEVYENKTWHLSQPDRLIKGAIKYFKIKKPLAVSVSTDLPAGTGLGTGGAIMVGLVNALSRYQNLKFDNDKIANLAYMIEKEKLGFFCGKKDQYSTTFGGLTLIKYLPNKKVEVTPIHLKKNNLSALMNHILVFDTGIMRDSDKILSTQQKVTYGNYLKELHILSQGALEIAYHLLRADFTKIGRLMDEHWQIRKRIIPGNTNAVIDRAYAKAMKAGALGGRISGAGGGGYLIIFAAPEKRSQIIKTIGLNQLTFKFEKDGTKII